MSQPDIDAVGRAAADLARRRAASTDTERALARVIAEPVDRRARTGPRSVTVAATVAALVLTAAVAVIATRGRADQQSVTAVKPRPAPAPAHQAPLGPADGLASIGLPVRIEPATGLLDGQSVVARGSGFMAGETVGAALCGQEVTTAVPRTGACDLGFVAVASADPTGSIAITVTVHRTITTGAFGTIDCAQAVGRCWIGLGALTDYDRSGRSPIGFAPVTGPAATATLALDPNDTVADGDVVTVTGRGLAPGRRVDLQLCTTVHELTCVAFGPSAGLTVTASGTFTARGQVWRWLPTAEELRDCRQDECEVTARLQVDQNQGKGSLDLIHSATLDFAATGMPPPRPTVAVEATTVQVGATMHVTGTGYGPNAPVGLAVCTRAQAAGPNLDCTMLRPDGTTSRDPAVVAPFLSDAQGAIDLTVAYAPENPVGTDPGTPPMCRRPGQRCWLEAAVRTDLGRADVRPNLAAQAVALTVAGG